MKCRHLDEKFGAELARRSGENISFSELLLLEIIDEHITSNREVIVQTINEPAEKTTLLLQKLEKEGFILLENGSYSLTSKGIITLEKCKEEFLKIMKEKIRRKR